MTISVSDIHNYLRLICRILIFHLQVHSHNSMLNEFLRMRKFKENECGESSRREHNKLIRLSALGTDHTPVLQ